ncbi:hypothetical protein E2C01_047748 [Portunus trituberculatus]|uniref:Uncharacterized protein n=1 Tax=Portunus trituberculatus TaxID=210409 RepID=A0A5B7G8Q5_PORTR|nr:hypothetical protein [Portunus trituberculatus]
MLTTTAPVTRTLIRHPSLSSAIHYEHHVITAITATERLNHSPVYQSEPIQTARSTKHKFTKPQGKTFNRIHITYSYTNTMALHLLTSAPPVCQPLPISLTATATSDRFSFKTVKQLGRVRYYL